jgi:hypothetical protein
VLMSGLSYDVSVSYDANVVQSCQIQLNLASLVWSHISEALI